MKKLGLMTAAFGAFITIGSLGNWFGRPTSVNVVAVKTMAATRTLKTASKNQNPRGVSMRLL